MILFEPLQPASARLPIGAGHALQPGSMLEDFEISEVLGLTSFGVVYLATNVAEHTTVALKEYLPVAIAARNAEGQVELHDPVHQEAFQRGLHSFISEALALSQFDHPNLMRVSCVWEANGTAYRAMPHYAGVSLLAQRFGMNSPPDEASVCTLRDDLLGALEVLHGAGLAHCQIEPLNILMLPGGRSVLLDFDAVRHAVLSDTHAPFVDAYSDAAKTRQRIADDLRAVAAVLHFAISGQWSEPVPGLAPRHELLTTVVARLKDSHPALNYSADFLSAIDTALAAAPADSPQSVAEFRALFEPRPVPELAPPSIQAPIAPPPQAESPVIEPNPKPDPAPVLPSVAPTPAPELAAPAPAPAVHARPKRYPPADHPKSEYPLNSSESILVLLAGFDRRPGSVTDDIEPFENPVVPTLTEEAEPALPPMRASLFDALDAGNALPHDGVGYGRIPAAPVPASNWRRVLLWGVIVLILVAASLLAWRLKG